MTAVLRIDFTPSDSDPLLLIYTASGGSLLGSAASDKIKLYLQRFLSSFVSSEASLSSNQTFRFVQKTRFQYCIFCNTWSIQNNQERNTIAFRNKTNGFNTDKLSFLIYYQHGFFNIFKYQNLEDSPSSLQVLRVT